MYGEKEESDQADENDKSCCIKLIFTPVVVLEYVNWGFYERLPVIPFIVTTVKIKEKFFNYFDESILN